MKEMVGSSCTLMPFARKALLLFAGVCAAALTGCSAGSSAPPAAVTVPAPVTPAVSPPVMAPTFALTGDTILVHDPSLIYANGVYYSLSTDPGDQPGRPQVGYIPIRTSTDKLNWTRTSQVFPSVPPFVQAYFAPTPFNAFWAPDVSFFNGLYHVYYAASMFASNTSLIGLATSPTMNPADKNYAWTDAGLVLASKSTDNFNAIDPSILVDTDSSASVTHVWLTYGSFWGGIYQREIDPSTGKFSTSNTTITNLATRPGVLYNPIEGANLVKHNGFYYLFVSFDFCCQTPASASNYKIAVGRGMSPQGPFVDQAGTPMLQGGGTILLQGNGSTWGAPGGASVLLDPARGDLITYHALNLTQNGLDFLFVNTITWPGDWPAITQ